jgi:hypothetical protein
LPSMRITLADLTVQLPEPARGRLLDDWVWLVEDARLPVLVTATGNAFVQRASTKEILFLDCTAGELTPVAEDPAAITARMQDPEFVREFLDVDTVAEMRKLGVRLSDGNVYSWKQPPILGGQRDASNLEPTDAEVHFAIAGQIHERVKDLPAGTPITSIRLRSRD